MKTVLGIDIAKEKFDVVLLQEGQAAVDGEFANTPKGFGQLLRFLKKRKVSDLQVCLEATGLYSEPVATFLYEQGYTVSLVNPHRIHTYAQSQGQRNKTDRLDARLIADFCQRHDLPAWTPPPPEWRELQQLVRHLADLEEMRQMERNRLQAGQLAPLVQADLQAHIAFLDTQIETLKKTIQDHIDRHPHLPEQRNLLVSIKGIGKLTAAKLLAEYRDLTAFDDVAQVVAFAGLNPQQHQSGKKRGASPISKMGRASIRASLFMPALVAQRFNPIILTFAQRLKARGLTKMEVTTACMRKLLHLAFGILKSGKPFDPTFLDQKA